MPWSVRAAIWRCCPHSSAPIFLQATKPPLALPGSQQPLTLTENIYERAHLAVYGRKTMSSNGTKGLGSMKPKISTALPGPNAKRILELDQRLMSPSYTRSYPLVVKRGQGSIIEDVDGNEFLDFSAGIAVVSTGHSHPEVVAAIQKQAAEFIHMSGTDIYYEQMPQLAERLSAIAPMRGPHKFYYGNSGTEAVECAFKLARYHTKRQNVIAFYGAFHGRTMGCLSLTASKPPQRPRLAPVVAGMPRIHFA